MNHVFSKPRAYPRQQSQEHLVLSRNQPLSNKGLIFVHPGRNEIGTRVRIHSNGIPDRP